MSQSKPTNQSLPEAKTVLKTIANNRMLALRAQGKPNGADFIRNQIELIDGARNVTALWDIGEAILKQNPPEGQGCCTYLVENMEVCFTMTSDECDSLQGVFVPRPCICPPPVE